MPVYRTARRGVTYSEALAEAYASAPEDVVVLDTLEFRHPEFTDSVFVVNDLTTLSAQLEATAPLHPSSYVTFQPVAFRFARPSESEGGAAPEVTVTVDNVARVLIPYLDLVKASRDPIQVTWRPYLASDLTAPHMNPPLTLTATGVQADMNSVVIRAGFSDLTNRRFPAREYTARLFPGLTAR